MARYVVSSLLMCGLLGACHGAGTRGAPPANHAPGATAGAVIAITSTPADAEFGVGGFVDGGALPAVSADGALVAALFHDTTDFVGLPVDTVVVWRTTDGARVGAVASSDGQPPDDPAAPSRADDAAARATQATALLATARWVHAPAPVTVTSHEDGQGDDITLADGRTLRFQDETFALAGAAVTPVSFDAPGRGAGEDGDRGGCGAIFGVDVLAGGDRWLLVAPGRVNLGGDSCVGRLTADLAQVIRY